MSAYTIDVTDTSFDYEVIAYSQQETLVVVHFWAVWCIPCRVVDQVLREMAAESDGLFRLARVDVDQNPKLTRRFQIQSIPTLRAFHLGQNIARLSGNMDAAQVRAFMRSILPDSSQLLLEKGESLLKLSQPAQAGEAFAAYLKTHPAHPGALLGLGKSLLYQGRGRDALDTLRSVPGNSPAYAQAQELLAIAEAITRLRYADPLAEDSPLEAAWWRAVNLIARGNFPAALDGLLDILRADKTFGNGKARALILSVLALWGDDEPLAVQYRRELNSILFS
ncbi:MAG: thioredoxin [Anaerolineales bacterium]